MARPLPLALALALVLTMAACAEKTITTDAAPATTTTPAQPFDSSLSTRATAPATTAAAVTEAALGQSLTVNPGGHRVTAYAWKAPVRSTNQFNVPDTGNQFAAADIEVCAGPGGDRIGPNPFDYQVAMPDNTRLRPANSAGLQQPTLQSTPLQAGECIRGWVNFEVPATPAPRFLIYSSGGASARWRLT